MTRTPLFLVVFLMLVCAVQAQQQSDYDIQQSFEQRAAALRQRIDSASTTGELDALRGQIETLAIDFQPHKEFLDRALYPDTFEGRIATLRRLHGIANSRLSTIQTQVQRITELETDLASLTGRLDTLSGEREKLFRDLQSANRSVSSLRETVRRLTTNLQANDRLVFSLVDSIFLPYDRNMRQSSDIEKEDIAGKLQQANALTRVYDVAADNVRFVRDTQLQPKDFGSLIDQYQQFQVRWEGLSDKMRDVAAATSRRASQSPPAARGKKNPAAAQAAQLAASVPGRGAQVDSVLHAWNGALMDAFWNGVEKEFTGKGIAVNHFTDGPGFSNSVRALVATYKSSGADPVPFVDQVWKERIDKDWREALTRDAVLGKAEYASLDQAVSELNQKTVDLRLILYIVGIILIGAAAWWLISRRSRTAPPADAA